ncbi:MAG: hypothetical protein ACI4OA_05375 [Selenomonadaceae bacterium]
MAGGFFRTVFGAIFGFFASIIGFFAGCVKRSIGRIYGVFFAIFTMIFDQIFGFLRWTLSIALALFTYVGVKGFTFLIEDYYKAEDTIVPLVLHIALEGVVMVIPIIVCAYFFAHKWRVTAAFFSLVAMTSLNAFTLLRAMESASPAAPVWQIGTVTVLCAVVGLATVVEMKDFRDNSRARAEGIDESDEEEEGMEPNPA